ncbi:MAG: alpha/beta fold hydrolase [Promethearchaeota archaeon]
MKIKTGLFNGKYPFIKVGNVAKEGGKPDLGKQDKLVIMFPGSEDLLMSDVKNPRIFARIYKKLFPKDYSILILGYDPNMEPSTSPAQVTEDLAHLVKEIAGPGIVMGISYGGFVALTFAAKYPVLTRKLILGSSAGVISEPGMNVGLRWMESLRNDHPKEIFKEFGGLFRKKTMGAFMKFIVKWGWPFLRKKLNPPTTLINAYEGAMNMEGKFKEFASKIHAPTLVVVGTADQIFAVEDCRETVDLLPDARLETFEKGTHTLVFEESNKCKKVISKFIESNG